MGHWVWALVAELELNPQNRHSGRRQPSPEELFSEGCLCTMALIRLHMQNKLNVKQNKPLFSVASIDLELAV